MSNSEYQRRLIERYKANTATEKELQALFGMLSNNEINAAMEEDMDSEIASLNTTSQKGNFRRNIKWHKYSVAAVILITICVGFVYLYKGKHNLKNVVAKTTHDIPPGKNAAYLTLSNGRRLTLTSLANGTIVKQAGVNITKTATGRLIYIVTDDVQQRAEVNAFNTIETPRGGQYEVALPDGTRLWLNAASSLKYPTSFTALKTREVELTGEAYFEVAKDKKPFIVKTAQQAVKVLGTHFNINAYTDEPNVKTTLLQGSVHVSSLLAANGEKQAERILKPGQQSILNRSGIAVKEVETDEAVAWKNGQFMFTSEPISAIMRKVSRWYDVEVEYKGDIANKRFTGTVSRYANVSELLQTLELTDRIRFKLNGRKITVSENQQ